MNATSAGTGRSRFVGTTGRNAVPSSYLQTCLGPEGTSMVLRLPTGEADLS